MIRRLHRKAWFVWTLWALWSTLGGASPAIGAGTEDLVWTTGRVIDANGKPVTNAVVAVYDDRNQVVDYARTDSNGEYALAVPRKVMHLDKPRRGFLAQVFTGVTRFVGGATEFVANPLRVGVRAITASQAATASDPVTQGGIAAAGAAVDQVLGMMTPRRRPRATSGTEERKEPGALVIKVTAPGHKDLVAVNRVYWMQQETFRAGGKQTRTTAAWLDPIKVVPANTSGSSEILEDYLHFTSARLEPSIAEAGQRVKIIAHLAMPPEPRIHAVVVARNNRTGQIWELYPSEPGVYVGEFVIDRRFPRNDQIISILAYAANDAAPGRRPEVERVLIRSGLWDASRPFAYDPLKVVSRNRADVVLTVVASGKRR